MQFENWQEGMHASFTASNKAEHEQHIIMTTQLPFVFSIPAAKPLLRPSLSSWKVIVLQRGTFLSNCLHVFLRSTSAWIEH